MRWLEEIRVKTQPRLEKQVKQFLLETAASIAHKKHLRQASVYSHYSAPIGFSLVLSWDTPSVPSEGSETSMLILDGLQALGFVDHTVLLKVEGLKIELLAS